MSSLHICFIANLINNLVLKRPCWRNFVSCSERCVGVVLCLFFVEDVVNDLSVVMHYYLVYNVNRLVIDVTGHHCVLQELKAVINMDAFFYVLVFSLSNARSLSWCLFCVLFCALLSCSFSLVLFWRAQVNDLLELHDTRQEFSVVKDALFLATVFNLGWLYGLLDPCICFCGFG